MALWPTRKRLFTSPRLALRPVCLGESARCRETSDVVHVHREARCDRIRFTPARRSSNPSKPRSNARRFVCRVNDAHGRGRSSPLCRPPWSFRTRVIDEKRAEGMSYRHLQPAYSVFKDENLRPVSLARDPVVTLVWRKQSPHTALTRPYCGGRIASGGMQRIIGFGDLAKGEACSASRPRCIPTVCRTVTNSTRRSLRALGSKEPLV